MKTITPTYDKTRPTSARYFLLDLGAARVTKEPLDIIAADAFAAFEFALFMSLFRGLDLEFSEAENLS